jgi:hypothetical protein
LWARWIKWDPSVTQRYNALRLSAQKRLSHGVSANVNWTWSHCTGYMQGFNSKQDQTVTAPGNPLFDRGDCDRDRRHIVSQLHSGHSDSSFRESDAANRGDRLAVGRNLQLLKPEYQSPCRSALTGS